MVLFCGDINSPSSSDESVTLTRISGEPAGERCDEGGRKVESGSDLNNNGRLDDSEIIDTEYECGAWKVWDGDFTVSDMASVQEITEITEITGDLFVQADTAEVLLEDLDFLNAFVIVGGNLRLLHNHNLKNVNGLSSLSSNFNGGFLFHKVGTA